jgi:hypothetical protein
LILGDKSAGNLSSAYSVTTPNIASDKITSGVNVIECGQNEVLYFMFNGTNF